MKDYSDTMPKIDSNVVEFCEHILYICENYILAFPIPVEYYANYLHNILPDLLTYLLGSPEKRGWIQTRTNPSQTKAIRNLLSAEGPFFQALMRLSLMKERYAYDVEVGMLADDVQQILEEGNVSQLPKVYRDATYVCWSDDGSSNCNIQFNVLQFYLYYFASAPGFTAHTKTKNGEKCAKETFSSDALGSGAIFGDTQLITDSNNIYRTLLDEYMFYLIPIAPHIGALQFPKIIGSFFFDALIELWIRSQWIYEGEKPKTKNHLHFLKTFIIYITSQDLRHTYAEPQALLYQVYRGTLGELFMMLTRFACNWSFDDDFLQVVDIWATWCAPWKQLLEPSAFHVIKNEWGRFILENLCYYILLVEFFISRFSMFRFPEISEEQSQRQANTLLGERRILQRFLSVIKAPGIVDFLALVEEGLNEIHLASTIPDLEASDAPFKAISLQCFGADTSKTSSIYECLLHTYQFSVHATGGGWKKPKGIYTGCICPRFEALLKVMDILYNEILIRENDMAIGKAKKLLGRSSVDYLEQMYKQLSVTFKITDIWHSHRMTPPISSIKNNRLLWTKQQDHSQVKTETHLTENAVRQSQSQGLFLTNEQIQAIQNGTLQCSTENVQPLGARAKEHIRSYEMAYIVRWTLSVDTCLNTMYYRMVPEKYRLSIFPKHITVKPLATTINFIYVSLLLTLTMILIADTWFPVLV